MAPRLGAGFVLAGCCDMIVAADTAQLSGCRKIDVGQGGGASILQPPAAAIQACAEYADGESRARRRKLYRLGRN